MWYVLIGFGIMLTFVGYGIYFRKKTYDEVDRLEARKIEIMNRPINDDLAKVKKLNMSGQTEANFEKWRAKWDELITGKLPQVEERLYDAEEAADKYRFKKAKLINEETRSILTEAAEEIDNIRAEVDELVNREASNEVEIEELKSVFRDRKKLLLARQHTYGKAAARLELMLEDAAEKFYLYEEKTQQGNYLEAAELVSEIREMIEQVKVKMDMLPSLLQQTSSVLPAQLKELAEGCKEMEEGGYSIEEFGFQLELHAMTKKLAEHHEALEKAEVDIASAELTEMKQRINEIYDQLEEEVKAKQVIEQELPDIGPLLDTMQTSLLHTKNETDAVQESYQLFEELDTQKQIEAEFETLLVAYSQTKEKVKEKKVSFFFARQELKEIKKKIEEIKVAHEDYKVMLESLRQDERKAKESVLTLKKLLVDSKREIHKSMLPGVPEHYIKEIEYAEESIVEVAAKLDETPLNMTAVNQLLKTAEADAEKVYDKTIHMIDQAQLAERIIQYGNRYRSRFPHVAQQLNEAERAFRQFEYDEALEIAATTVEKIEPGALKKMEKMLSEYQEV